MTQRSNIDISLIITFHRESYIAGWMLDNINGLRREADVMGLSHEMICVLDKADQDTDSVVRAHDSLRSQDKVIQVVNGDLATSRNDGVSQAKGEFVATFDGDDYYSRNWLTQAYKVARSRPLQRVIQPTFIVSFGASHNIMKVLDQENDVVPHETLLTSNPWSSSVFVARQALEDCPYQTTRAEATGFGFEDWHWNLEMLAKGYKFITAPETARYFRRRPNSLLMREMGSRAIVRPSAFFRPKRNSESRP